MILSKLKVLITGSTSGLGLALVKEFLNAGAKVIVTGLTEAEVDKTVTKLEGLYPENAGISGFVLDIRDIKSIESVLAQVGKIDVLVNNAGVYTDGELETTELNKIQLLINTNMLGTIQMTQAVLKQMKTSGNGAICNILSTRAIEPGVGKTIYAATKAGLKMFFECLKLELTDTNIKILNFLPSGMKTNLFQAAGVEDKDLDSFIDPKDVAEIVVDMLKKSDKTLIEQIVIQKPKNSKI